MALLSRVLLAAYGATLALMQPLLRRRLARRGQQEPGYLVAVDERFGRYTQPAGEGYVWLHAVSLGETRAAAILLAELRRQWPGMRLLLTHGTATGRAEGTKLLREGDVQVWQPWDTPGAVRRFLAHFRPRLGLLMETEVWPQLVAGCARAGMPLALANARLSAKSLRQGERLAWLSRPAYAALAAAWAQTEDDAQRLRALGAPVRGVFGNLKFDAEPDAAQLARGQAWRAAAGRPVLVFASSREGEEALLLDVLAAQAGAGDAVDAMDAVQWLIVPRHPQRFEAVAGLVASRGFAVARRSAWGDAPPPAAARTVWLGDSLGEMALYYGLADVALLGGSFEPLGGQNLIEAAACRCPVVLGPSTFNFAEAAELALAAGAAQRVADLGEAVAAATALATDPPRLARSQAAAQAFAGAHRGAARRTAEAAQALAKMRDQAGS